MPTLNLTETIHLADGDYDVVEHRNPFVRLRNTTTGVCTDMHLTELARSASGFGQATSYSPSLQRLNQQKPEQLKVTLIWADHVSEILTGQHPRKVEVRAEYDPAKSLNSRVAAKVIELRAAGFSASRATLMRKIQGYRAQGPAGVVDRRSVRQDGPLDNLDPLIRDVLCEVIANQTNRSTGTKSRLIVETQAELLKQFGAEAPPMPPESSMYRYIKALTKGLHTTGSAMTRRSLANRPDRTYIARTPVRPGAQVQVDSTPLDILVKVSSGPPVRPILTIMIDVATRSIIASSMRLTATKGVDHAALLASALVPASNRPSRKAFRQLLQARNPQCTLLSEEERARVELTRPFIHPQRIMMDNGRDYISPVALSAAQRFDIDVTFSAIRTPTDKAVVERTFGSIKTLFAQHLPGFTGGSPDKRGHNVEKENLLDVFMLNELFEDWVSNVWQNRPHSGLRDTMDPRIKLSPNQMYAAASALTGTVHIPLGPVDYLELLPSEFRSITAVGVEFDSRQYDSTELHPLRGTKSKNPGKKGAWEIKYDPYNPMAIWVRSPSGALIACRVRNADAAHNPYAGQLVTTARSEDRATVAMIGATVNGAPMHHPLPEDTDPVEYGPDPELDDDDLGLFDPTEV